jgi:DNA primase catalytic subunit
MYRFTHLVISLPLFIASIAMAPIKPALAETVGIERALELLAKSTVVDAKCHVLSAAEREELSRYVSRAEVSAAEKTTLEITRSSLATGRKAGQAMTCGAVASADVRDTLRAAREAIKSLSKNDKIAATSPVLQDQPQPAIKGKLSNYARITEAYFLERRCTYLSDRQISEFYKAVLRNHRAAMAQFGRSAVYQARKTAESRADGQKCNATGRARVAASYAEIASR